MKTKFAIVLITTAMIYGIELANAEDIVLKYGNIYKHTNTDVNIKITETGGKIIDILISPKLNYIAYTKAVKWVEEHNDAPDIKNNVDLVPICSIEIYDIGNKKVLASIEPKKNNCEFLRLDSWISESELLFHDADQVAVCGGYIFNLKNKQSIELDDEEYELKREKTFNKNRAP